MKINVMFDDEYKGGVYESISEDEQLEFCPVCKHTKLLHFGIWIDLGEWEPLSKARPCIKNTDSCHCMYFIDCLIEEE